MTFFAPLPHARLIVIRATLNPCNISAGIGPDLARHEQRLFLGLAGLDFRARTYAAAPGGVIERKRGFLRADRAMRGAAVGPRRSLRHRDGARGARPLPSPRRDWPA